MNKRIIRVFPRHTNASPDDSLAKFGLPEMWDEADEVHVSVAFDWDKPKAERLAKEWSCVTSCVTVGGPAYDDPGGDFTPGVYLKRGYTITSRGCPNKCWFCEAWKNEGNTIRELPIYDGWNLLDNNILACSDSHVESVFSMLSKQPKRPLLTGGIEAARLKPWHVDWLAKLKPKTMWFAYDTPDDWEPIVQAAKLLQSAGFLGPSHETGCYVLIGWPGDSLTNAFNRLVQTAELGYFPQAMLFDNGEHLKTHSLPQWKKLRWEWSNKIVVGSNIQKIKRLKQKGER